MITNKGTHAGLIEATRLTREGRLLEATALIQRVLGRNTAFAESADRPTPMPKRAASSDVIDIDSFEVPEVSEPIGAANGRSTPLQSAHDDDPSLSARLESFLRKKGLRNSVVDAPSPESKAADGQPGRFESGFYANQAGARPYKLYIPTSYTGQPLPLVVMLHGCTQTPDDFASGTRMNALAEERQCFVLYPEQTQAANRSRCWNWFKRGDQQRDQGEAAILAGMTREVLNRYRIDANKVYVAGLSAGGAMAVVLGAAFPDLYAAVGVHSGLACGSAHDLPSALAAMRGTPASSGRNSSSTPAAPAIRTIVFHGDRDKTVHPRNGEHVVAQSAERNGIAGADAAIERGQAPGGHAYTRSVHRDSTGRVVLEHWLVHGGGHAWFGGSSRGSYADPRGPDAAREMLRFFLSERH